ncbi:hypothetical protein RclHR1_06510005 [Rhizophagus clarus]|uniref:Uncharacterized protein n=1 Tax=Rhizophagus clarus TaxID=94130 RepID=A0A2Z6RS24_9GLOM|nr:hypothetical protein RclHR1_06510005 [Rhizophagus clarus]
MNITNQTLELRLPDEYYEPDFGIEASEGDEYYELDFGIETSEEGGKGICFIRNIFNVSSLLFVGCQTNIMNWTLELRQTNTMNWALECHQTSQTNPDLKCKE